MDTIHIDTRKDSLGYDTVSYRKKVIMERSNPKIYGFDHKFWIVLAAMVAVLVEIYLK